MFIILKILVESEITYRTYFYCIVNKVIKNKKQSMSRNTQTRGLQKVITLKLILTGRYHNYDYTTHINT